MAISIGDAVLQIGADTSKLERSLKGIGDKMTKMGKNLTMKVTLPLVAIGIGAFKMAGDFDQAFRKVNVMLRASTEEAIAYKKSILEISSATGKAATDVADAFFQIVSAGHRGADALAILEIAMRGAVGGAADAITTTAALTKAMNIFGLVGVEGATRAMDVFFGIVDTGLLTFEELANSFPRAATMAAGLGATIEEVGAALGTLTKVSGSTEQASTALNAVFTQLVKPSEQLRALYEKWGVSTGPEAIKKFGGLKAVLDKVTESTGGNVDVLAQLFPNVEAIRAILPLTTTNAEDFVAALDTVTDSAGKTSDAFDEMATGPGFQMNQMMTNLKNSAIVLGDAISETLGPILGGLIDKLKGAAEGFADLSSPIKTAIIVIGFFVAALGPAIWFTGFFIKQLIALKLAFMAVTGSTIVTTAVLKLAIGASISLRLAFVALLGTVLALAAGIGMVIFGITQLIKNSRIRRKQAELEAKQEEILVKLREEHAKMMEGLDNKYLHLLREAKEMGFVIGEEQEAYLKLNEAIKTTSYEQDRLTEAMKVAAKKWRIATDATKELTEQNRELLGLYEELSESKETDLGLVEEQLIRYKELGGVLTTEAEAWLVNRDAMRAANAELERHIALRNALMPAIMAVRRGVITPEVYFQLAAKVSRVREAAGLPGYQYGGPILGPTLLTSLRTMQPYAIAGEGGRRERVVPGNGIQVANIIVELDGRVLAQALGEPLVDEIRLKTGARY